MCNFSGVVYMIKFLCLLGLHISTKETSECGWNPDGTTRFVTGRECENCGKVRWGK